jgi:hypothetical protein
MFTPVTISTAVSDIGQYTSHNGGPPHISTVPARQSPPYPFAAGLVSSPKTPAPRRARPGWSGGIGPDLVSSQFWIGAANRGGFRSRCSTVDVVGEEPSAKVSRAMW